MGLHWIWNWGKLFPRGEDYALVGWRLLHVSDCFFYPVVLEHLMSCLLASGMRESTVCGGQPLRVLVSNMSVAA